MNFGCCTKQNRVEISSSRVFHGWTWSSNLDYLPHKQKRTKNSAVEGRFVESGVVWEKTYKVCLSEDNEKRTQWVNASWFRFRIKKDASRTAKKQVPILIFRAKHPQIVFLCSKHERCAPDKLETAFVIDQRRAKKYAKKWSKLACEFVAFTNGFESDFTSGIKFSSHVHEARQCLTLIKLKHCFCLRISHNQGLSIEEITNHPKSTITNENPRRTAYMDTI